MPWPNQFAKGPLALAVEEYVQSPRNARTLLGELERFLEVPNFYAIKTFDFFVRFGDLEIVAPAPEGKTTMLQHTVHYFGLDRYLGNEPGDYKPGQQLVAAGAAGAGYEEDYVIAAFQALHRALEVSLGLPGSPTEREPNADPWPVEIFWSCGQPETRSWVSWRRNPYDERHGQVTVVFSSHRPAAGRELVRAVEADNYRVRQFQRVVGAPASESRGMEVYRVDPSVPGAFKYELLGDSGIPCAYTRDQIEQRLQ